MRMMRHQSQPHSVCTRRQPLATVRAVQCQGVRPKNNIRLVYFSAPARAECSRLMLTLGMVAFDDERISREQWAELKPKTPYGQLPILEVHGKQLAQSSAIDRYVAKLTGHYPHEPWDQARVDSIVAFTDEFMAQFIPTFYIKDAEAKAAAQKDVVVGPLAQRLDKLESMLAALPPNAFLVGNQLTWADMAVYCTVCNLTSGFISAIPKDLIMKGYPSIEKFRHRIASLPGVMAYFERAQHVTDVTRASFRPATFPMTVNA